MFDTNNNEHNTFEPNNNLLEANVDLSNNAYGLDATENKTDSVNYIPGTLGADDFVIDSEYKLNVISGNGNIDYGLGKYDTLDFSNISIDQVEELNLANTDKGGIVFNTKNGARVFDYIALDDGTKVLFESIERLVFKDNLLNLNFNPDDTHFQDQWNLHMIGVQNAWRLTIGSDDVLIGIQDSGLGIDADGKYHSDLRDTLHYDNGNGVFSNLKDEFFIEAGTDSSPQTISHGTSVQGIIAADTNNGTGIAGINWNSDVYHIDFDVHNNPGDLSYVEATQQMIKQANSQGQNLVINMSWGNTTFGNLHPSHSDLEKLVADNPNTMFVITAGNDGHLGKAGIDSPAVLAKTYDNVIAVGASWGNKDATGAAQTPGTRIEYEDVWGSSYGEGLTLMAPSEVLATNATRKGGFDYSLKFAGTSAAAPHVTGVASLVWSANPNLTAAEVKEILSETAYDLGKEGYDLEYGHGLVNADAAVRRAIALGRDDNSSAIDKTDTTNVSNHQVQTSFAFSDNDQIIWQAASRALAKTNINHHQAQTSFSFSDNEGITWQAASNQSDRSLDNTDNQVAINDNQITEQVELKLPTSLFNYEAVGMKDILELSGRVLQDEITSSPLYAESLAA